MKKRIFSIFIAIVTVLTLFPCAAFAAETQYKYCPNCGYVLNIEYKTIDGNVLFDVVGQYFYYSVETCPECAYRNKDWHLGPLHSTTVRPGNTPDIPGYTAPGVPSVDATGQLIVYPTVLKGELSHYYKTFNGTSAYDGNCEYVISESIDLATMSASASYRSTTSNNTAVYGEHWFRPYYYFEFEASVDGVYTVHYPTVTTHAVTLTGEPVDGNWTCYVDCYKVPLDFPSSPLVRIWASDPDTIYKGNRRRYTVFNYGVDAAGGGHGGIAYSQQVSPFYLTCTPLTAYEKTTSITINNTTINGNIYYDASTNLYYIYQDGNTIPVIYNPETTEVTTYDIDTNNYYTIIINPDLAPTPTPTPGGSTDPTPTPDPGSTDPTPTPAPGGTDPSNPGASGSTPGNPFGDIFGGALDLLQDVLGAILQVIWTLLSSLFGIVTWLITQVTTLIPFLPAPAVAALAGGVILVIIIKILRFIGGLLP